MSDFPTDPLEFEDFTGIFVGGTTVLILESRTDRVEAGRLVPARRLSANDWSLSLVSRWFGEYDYLIQRDWNKRLKLREFDEFDFDFKLFRDEYEEDLFRDDDYDFIHKLNKW